MATQLKENLNTPYPLQDMESDMCGIVLSTCGPNTIDLINKSRQTRR